MNSHMGLEMPEVIGVQDKIVEKRDKEVDLGV
jgi:hypothetical protein